MPTRTYSWSDPSPVLASARAQSGLDFLRSVSGRDRPQAAPVAECLGFELVEVGEGRAVFELLAGEQHHNPLGTVHGGVLATLCDSATGAAVHATLPRGFAYTTLEIKVSFLRPASARSGRLRAEGAVISRGSRVATAEARLVDGAGKLVAHATSTCLIFEVGAERAEPVG